MEINHIELREVSEVLNSFNKIIITSHVNPDGDSFGSSISLYLYLLQQKKEPKIIFYNDIPENYKYLDGYNHLEIYDKELHKDKILNAELIIICDVNDTKRLKSMEKYVLESKSKKLVIDHHLEPVEFADYYYIDTEASSTGELIYKIISNDNESYITPTIANALYVAIMTDTGSFRFPRTDSEVHSIISKLIEFGADPVKNYEYVYNQFSISALKLLGYAFYTMELYYNNKLCIMTLTKDIFNKISAIEDDVEGIVEKTLSIKGVKVGILISEAPSRNEIRISFRSKDTYNVRDFASKLGGGGHFHAAGARIYNQEIKTIKSQIIEDIGYLFS